MDVKQEMLKLLQVSEQLEQDVYHICFLGHRLPAKCKTS